MTLFLYLLLWTIYWINRSGVSHPMAWYDGVWALVVFLHSLGYSALLTDISPHALTVLLISFSTINLSCIFFHSFYLKRRKTWKTSPPVPVLRLSAASLGRIYYINLGLFGFECLWFRGVPLLWLFNGDVRNYGDFGIPTFHGIVMGLNLLFFTYYSAISPKGNRQKIFYSLMVGILSVNRQVVISMFFQWAFAYTLLHGSVRRIALQLLGVGTGVLVLFVALGNIRSDTSAFLSNAQLTIDSPALLALSWVYVYIVMAFQNAISIFDAVSRYYLGEISVRTFAPSIVRSLVWGVQKGSADLEIYKFLPTATFNVSGYMSELYMDFGVYGIAVFNAIVGYFCARIYDLWSTSRRNARNILFVAIIGQCLVLSFFFNMFLYLPIIFQFAFAGWLFRTVESTERSRVTISAQ